MSIENQVPEGSAPEGRFLTDRRRSHGHDEGFLLDSLFRSVRDWVIVTDPSFRITRINAAAEAGLGKEAASLIGQAIGDCLLEIEPCASLELAAKECGSPLVARSFSALIPGHPRRRRFSLRGLFEGEARCGFLVTGGSLEENIRGDGVSAVMELSRRILDGLPFAVILIERAERVIIDCNDRFSFLFGWERESCLGSSTRILFGSDLDFQQYRAMADRSFRSSGIYVVERAFYDSAGAQLHCRLTVLPLFVSGTRNEYAICLFQDKTIEQRRERQISALADQLEKATGGLVAAYRNNERSLASPSSLGEYGASRRQMEIGRSIIDGRSTKEISVELGLAESTVKNHLVALYKKLGVVSRVEFMRLVAERGILPL